MTRIASALDDDVVASPAPLATGRSRIRALALENGFVAADVSPRSYDDEFIRADRVVHLTYGPDGCVIEILVNGECLFNRDRSLAAHRNRTGSGA
jgi:hypothetical protein